MTHVGRGRKRSVESILAPIIMVGFFLAGCWVVTRLFPVELHQTAQWLQERIGSLFH